MFYSHELLGRKTPLGAIWTLAHGRKLSKGKIISINVREICDEIMQPGVPHSLRLQGILVGGVVMVFSKQQTYLLEDLQDMMRRVRAAATDTARAGGAIKAEKGKGKGRGKQGADGNNQARLEAITMMDMEDLMAPVAYGDEDILGLLAGGSLSDALASQGAVPVDRRRLEGAELAGDLFVMPSLAGGATSEGGDTDAQGRPASKHSRGTRTTGSGREQEEVYGGLDMMHQDQWLNPEDEVFADPAMDAFDLLGGMDLPQPAAGPAGTSDRSRDQTTSSQQHKQAVSGDTTEAATPAAAAAAAAAAAGGMGVGGGAGGVPYEFDNQMFVMEDAASQEAQAHHLEAEGPDDSDQQQGRDQGDAGVEQAVRRAKQQRKRKAGTLVMDDLDSLLIKKQVYREWSLNSSPLVNNGIKPSTPLQAHTSAAAPLLTGNSMAGIGLAALPFGAFAAAAGGAGVPLCPELVALFRGPEEAAAAERTGARKGRPQQPSSPEVNNSTGEGSLPGMLPYAHKLPLDLHQVPHEDDMQQMMDLQEGELQDMMMMPESPPHHAGDQEMVSNDEAHDQLGDLPFNGDIEVERMRAAATPGSSDGSLQNLLLPGGGGSAMGRKGLTSAARDSNATSAGGSDLAAARVRRGGSGLGGSGAKRRLGSADLGVADDLDIFFGTGNLADLLPDIQAEHFYDEQQQGEGEGTDSEPAEGGAALPGRRSGSLGVGSDRSLTPYSSSQFPLLEETEPDQPTQGGLLGQQAALSKTTRLALSIFQERLQRSSEQAAAAAADAGDDAAAAAEPSVSFFGLIKDGRLSRNQAATLFYQVCVTSTAGFVSASQERPYGDITIMQGGRQL